MAIKSELLGLCNWIFCDFLFSMRLSNGEYSKNFWLDMDLMNLARMTPFTVLDKNQNYLVRAKFYQLGWNVGSRKCNKSRCKVCNNIERTDLFSSTVTGETYKINYYFNCDSKCLVCLITCWTSKLQYTGQTCEIFQKSIGTITGAVLENQRSVMNAKKIYLHEHFFQDDHHGFLNTAQVILTDKTQASDPTKSKYFWMRALKTYYPHGLNFEETY